MAPASDSRFSSAPVSTPFPPPPPARPPADLGFAVSHQVTPIPGRADLFQLRTTVTPRLGEALLSVADVAARLGIGVRQAQRLMASGAIRSHRPGLRRRHVYQRDLDAYCRARGVA
ncbi:MAG: hypothetical protein JWM59_233 [Verrucomicrobiales bacterium]|nr:hypothetical protein [Verrucomicrobiales bacterium]